MELIWEKVALQVEQSTQKIKAVHWKIVNLNTGANVYGVTDITCVSKDCPKTNSELSNSEIMDRVKQSLGEDCVLEYESIISDNIENENIIYIS